MSSPPDVFLPEPLQTPSGKRQRTAVRKPQRQKQQQQPLNGGGLASKAAEAAQAAAVSGEPVDMEPVELDPSAATEQLLAHVSSHVKDFVRALEKVQPVIREVSGMVTEQWNKEQERSAQLRGDCEAERKKMHAVLAGMSSFIHGLSTPDGGAETDSSSSA